MKLSKPFNKYFDHTLLKPEASLLQINSLLEEAVRGDFASVCVNGCHVKTASKYLKKSGCDVKVATVIGFPLGASATEAKASEAAIALRDGAHEVDMVLNIGALKAGRLPYVTNEIKEIKKIHPFVKVIIETCLLTDHEIVSACHAVMDGGADFIKTSTGFSSDGAKVEHIKLMRDAIADYSAISGIPPIKIKASGGIRTIDDALAMIKAGADRLGCSASVEILKQYRAKHL